MQVSTQCATVRDRKRKFIQCLCQTHSIFATSVYA